MKNKTIKNKYYYLDLAINTMYIITLSLAILGLIFLIANIEIIELMTILTISSLFVLCILLTINVIMQ